jgi:hypothetical protein
MVVIIYSSKKYDKKPILTAQIIKDPPPKFKNLTDMTEGEKLQFIVDAYFSNTNTPEDKKAELIKKQDDYIASLPIDDTSCKDMYDGCPAWAEAGECEINPEFMLYYCGKSCKSCALNEQQKSDLVGIYNSRDLKTCAVHSDHSGYPGPFPYLFELYSYSAPLLD